MALLDDLDLVVALDIALDIALGVPDVPDGHNFVFGTGSIAGRVDLVRFRCHGLGGDGLLVRVGQR